MFGFSQALAKRALAFDMKILYHNRKPVSDDLLAEFVSLTALLTREGRRWVLWHPHTS